MKTESEIRRRRKMALALAAVVLLMIALAFLADPFVTPWVNAHTSIPVKRAAILVSRIGDWPAHVAIGVFGAAVAFLIRRRDWTRILFAMLIACALAGLTARVIKIATGRARPSVRTEAVWDGPRLHARYNAFPSGHTASSAAFFAALFFARRKIGAPFLLVPVTIGAARVLAGAHYLSDVVFAAALGVICALLTWKLILPLSTNRFNDSTL